MVMVANQSKLEFGFLAGRYPGSIGHLYSPGGQRGPFRFLPYALDNGRYPAWQKNLEWDEDAWRALLAWAKRAAQAPLWVLVPDFVASRDLTLEMWHRYIGDVRGNGFRPGFAVQDGMSFDDVPSDDCMLFLGGTTGWKDAAIRPWCSRFPGRVHVGRVNYRDRLMLSFEAGAVSVDGTGWRFSESGPSGGQLGQLVAFIESTHGERKAA